MKFNKLILNFSVLIILFLLAGNHFLHAQEAEDKKEKKEKISFRDPEDGTFDLSIYMSTLTGVLPIPILITEPAFGYGGGLMLTFLHPQKKEFDRPVPPNISGVMGFYTENNSWFAGGFHFHVWGPDRVRYLGAIGKPYFNFYYYGNNNDYLSVNPAELNVDAFATLHRIQLRTAKTNLFIGLSYIYFKTNNSIDTIPNRRVINKIINSIDGKSTTSSINPIINWDSRDNIFTTKKGLNTGLEFTYNAIWLGADENFYKLNPFFLGYIPISQRLYSAWRFESYFMLGDAPLYSLPYINLRGVPTMRYQSDNTMLVETEWRLRIRKKWSVNVFTGAGKAFSAFNAFDAATLVYNYGLGFKYELAKLYNMHMGLDFAWSNDGEFAFYIIMGSPWNR